MLEKYLNGGRVNTMIGTALGFGFVTPKQIPFAAGILACCIAFILANPLNGCLIFIVAYGLFWLLTGNDPSEFFERLSKPKRYIAEEPEVDFSRGGIPQAKENKKVTTTYKVKGKAQTYHHIEKKFKLKTYLQIELEGRVVGTYLLRRGNQLMLIFGWHVSGIDPALTSQQADSSLDSITDALNQLPKDLDLKFYQNVEGSFEEYLRLQYDVFDESLDPLSQEIIKSRAKRGEDLATSGRMQSNTITIFAKYRLTLGGDYAVKQGWLDDFLSQTQPLIGMILRKNFDSKKSWEKVFDNAYSYAFMKINSLLTSNRGFGLRVKPLTVHDLWARDYLELHEAPATKIPQYIVYDFNGLNPPIINSSTHALGAIFSPQKGISVVPQFDRGYVYLPGKRKYAAFMRFGQVQKFPPDKQNVHLGYMRYLWNVIADKKNITDCRIVTEITADRSGYERLLLDRTISDSMKREALALSKKTMDVVAIRQREEALEARDILEDRHVPFWVSTGIWLYRDNLEVLEQDISDLCQQISSASVERVQFYTEDVWFQTWAFEWEAFLTKPNHRRQKYMSFQTLPLLPLLKTQKLNSKGMMFLTRELNTPVFLDICNEKNHTGIFATSGAGKSNVILEMILEYVIHDDLVVLFDFPRPDGTSTYTVLIPILQKLGVKAAYHNVRENVVNIIELPDLRNATSERNREERWNDAIKSHVRLLVAIVIGISNNPDREVLVTSLLTDCYHDFHEEESIKTRYDLAIAGGYGSPEYDRMPILEDFVDFAENWFKQYIAHKAETNSELSKETIDLILIQLRGILRTPLGKSINGISSFNTNTQVLVIGLTDVAENLDSLLYAMSGLNALFRGAFSSKRSLLGIDEGTILYKFHFFARETGIIPVHGRKWGCNFLIAAQETTTIQKSISGDEIFKNLDNILCGYIQNPAISEMESLGFYPELLRYYTTQAFKPSKEHLQSYWYLKRSDQHLEVTHPPSHLLLALGATDPDEEAARAKIMAEYDDEIEGLKAFAEVNVKAKRQGSDLNFVMDNNFTTIEAKHESF